MKTKTIYVGIIPDIFGYGISVAASTWAGADKALREAYAEWKESRPDPSTNFDKSFAYYGGYITEVELGKSYHDGFTN
jgi:CO dehydrogenase/acetyl-CoA synthase delta subunit